MAWETIEGPPNAATEELANDMIDAILPLLEGQDRDDVAMAMLFVCMCILSGCSSSTERRIEIFRGAEGYFGDLARNHANG